MDVKPSEKKWKIILSLVISALGILYFIGQALIIGMFWLNSYIDSQTGLEQNLPLGVVLWSSILSAILILPILLISYFQIANRDIPKWLDTGRPIFSKLTKWVVLLWPIVVLLGWLISGRTNLASFLIGPMNVLVAGIPVLWIYYQAQRNLEGGSEIRKWRIFGFSLTVVPILVIIVELVAVIILAVFVIMGIQLINPQFGQDLMQISEMLRSNNGNIDDIIQVIEPYLREPIVIFSAFGLFAGIVPLIEELLKPLALWTLVGRKISPQEGFVGGLLCGAGFALMENVLYFTNVITPEDWIIVAIGRAGTGILHMLATGLTGWGLARAWRDKKWLFLGFSLLSAVVLHGLWNGLALASGFLPYLLGIEETSLAQDILFNTPLILLMILSAAGIFIINRRFQKHSIGSPDGQPNSSEVSGID